MFDSDRYIGIKHITGGDTFDGCDCLGLVRLFYKEHGWPEEFWDGGEPVTHENAHGKKAWNRLLRYFNRRLKKINNPDFLEFGDVVLFNVDGDLHLGIYMQEDLILAMAVPVDEGKTKSVLYHKRVWKQAFKKGYRMWKGRDKRCKNFQSE